MTHITIDEVKQHLYIDFEDDDNILSGYAEAAENIIAKRLNGEDDLTSYEDDNGEIPKALKQAVLIMTGNLYSNRESVAFNAIPQRIPYSFEYLLRPFKNYKTLGKTDAKKEGE